MTPQNASPKNDHAPQPVAVEHAFGIDPDITKSICADYEALSNDLEQAHALAADFQQELRGKSNEVAHLKQVLEKSESDLAKLQRSIADLREERHRLANELTVALGKERDLTRVTAERDRLILKLAQSEARCCALEAAQKTTQKAAAGPPAAQPPQPPEEPASSIMKSAVGEVSQAMQRLLAAIERSETSPKPAPRPATNSLPKARPGARRG
jgi:chromosome segregation ATPase